MKDYLRNLMTALTGRNPYREDLDRLKEDYEKVVSNVEALTTMYDKALESKSKAENQLGEYDKLLKASEKELESYRTLTDNLRERGKEKDAMIEDIRREYHQQVKNYEQRLKDYTRTIADLQKKVDKVLEKDSAQPHATEKKPRVKTKTKKQEPKTERKNEA